MASKAVIASNKGLRTRYRNSIQNELQKASGLLESDLSEMDESEVVQKVSKCLELLKLYSEKLDIQRDKVLGILGEEEEELINDMVNDDFDLNSTAESVCFDLKYYKEKLEIKKKEDNKQTEVSSTEKMFEIQNQMKDFMLSQIRQQREFMEKQEKRESDKTSVKLPKLDLASFEGNKLKWPEFWDTFQCTVHNNKKLSDIEKFTYLQSKLHGEAKSAISGLALTNENYRVAVSLLQERFGNIQEVVDLHYSKLMNLMPPINKTTSLRGFTDTVEKHLRSLEVLGKNIDQEIFVSMIKTKLPKEVLLQLEIQKGTAKEWTITSLRDRLKDYIVARERTDQDDKQNTQYKEASYKNRFRENAIAKNDKTHFRQNPSVSHSSGYRTSSEVLLAQDKKEELKYSARQCRYCEKMHWSDECPKFRTIEDRKERITGSCIRCLKDNHLAKDCKRSRNCVHCGEKDSHHRSLCPKKIPSKRSSEYVHITNEVNQEITEKECHEENALVSGDERVLMQTAKTNVMNMNNSNAKEIRLLFDSGSHRTYVTERLADELGLEKGDTHEIKLITFGSNKPKLIRTPLTKLQVKLKNGTYVTISANIVPNIAETMYKKPMKIVSSSFDSLVETLELADTIPGDCESFSIDLLIGNDYYLDFILPQKIEIQPGLYFLGSKLGWLLSGRTLDHEEDICDTNMLILTYGTNCTNTHVFTSVDKCLPQKPDLEDFWNVESIGITDKQTNTSDEIAKDSFKRTLLFQDGRYHVTWPWKEDNPHLPENRGLALGRLKSSIARMKNKPELMAKYDSVIQDQLVNGIIEKVDERNAEGRKHYIPHQAVITPQKSTTKIRIVYDASAKTRPGINSLNECLYRGPVMLHDLCGMLMRFRLHKIAMVADIEKAFLQISLQQDQRDVTRFIWIKDINKASTENENLQEYRFCRVPFGIISSPFLLGATIEHHLNSYQTDLANRLKHDIYVDNLITGCTNTAEAVQLYNGAKSMFKEASMNLREWTSNDSDVNDKIPKNDKTKTDCETVNVLGHQWNTYSDSISLKSGKFLSYESVTKRHVLKTVASVYDPLGLFSPVTVRGKMLLQTLWSKNIDWDDHIDVDDLTRWLAIKSDLLKLSELSVPRCVSVDNKNVKYTLLCFCDASDKAYCAAVYLHQSSETETKCELIFSKTRLAPAKGMTIPRLEIMAY